MKKVDKLKQDYQDHGYKIKSEKDGLIIFDTDKEFYKQNVDKKIDREHPIFTDKRGEQIGNKSTCIIHSICGHCNIYLEDNKCPKCQREFKQFQVKKPHIAYPDELNLEK